MGLDSNNPAVPSTNQPIPMDYWGKDHWSTFAFVAHWCAEAGEDGFDIELKRRFMRCDPSRHPGNAHIDWSADVPTRLLQGLLLEKHDDWDCLDDAVEAGLIKVGGTGAYPIITMTDEGLRVAARIVEHKTRGGNFGDFEG